MESIPAIFCILVGAIGWYYAFYSRSAHRLSGVESARTNQLRARLRRTGGLAMVLLGIAFAVGYYGPETHHATTTFIVAWSSVIILLPVIFVIGLFDLRLTRRLQKKVREQLK